jgi:hypothetical protein
VVAKKLAAPRESYARLVVHILRRPGLGSVQVGRRFGRVLRAAKRICLLCWRRLAMTQRPNDHESF